MVPVDLTVKSQEISCGMLHLTVKFTVKCVGLQLNEL